MGLQVALQDHPQTQLVGQVEHPRVRGIVAGPDGVDVRLLHHDQVGPGVIGVEDPAPVGVGLVPVHPAEDHLAPVDLQLVTVDPDGAEAQPQPYRLPGRADLGVVEPRHLGAPRLHRTHRELRQLRRRLEVPAHPELVDLDRHGERGVVGHDLRDRPEPVPSSAYGVRSQTSSRAPRGRPSRVMSRKIPGSHHWSWSSR